MTGQKKKMRLGDLLIAENVITEDQLKIALIEQKHTGQQLGKVLVSLGFVSEDVLRDLLGDSLRQDSVSLNQFIPDKAALEKIDQMIARQLKVLPINFDADKKELSVAMLDTFDVTVIDRLSQMVGAEIEIKPVLVTEGELDQALDRFYGFELSIDGILTELERYDSIDHRQVQQQTTHPIVRLIDAILLEAVKMGASDIHFEPEAKYLRIRYRIDGVLRQIRSLHHKFWNAMLVRLKVISEMDITETRLSQDGRISLTIGTHEIDFRVASQPTVHGENLVLRILDRKKGIVPLERLQLSAHAFSQLQLMLARPEGIIIMTGPTGSGKTTTLYSMLNYLNDESVNIMTLEDPVEYPMTMVRQCSLNAALKMDFASGIRSLMRQDPDIILVGEVRDEETATMAFRAAMTGHKVFTTLHTNSAVASFTRLRDIGIQDSVLSGNVIGIVAQRLLRRLCEHCKQQVEASDLEKKLLACGNTPDPVMIYQAIGCEHCYQSGYQGRLAVMEVLRMDRELDDLVARGATALEIERQARKTGFKSLVDEGVAKILEGETSLEELGRIVDLTQQCF